MDTRLHLRDCYDLCYNRPRRSKWANEEEIEGKKAKREQVDERRRRLNSISEDLRNVLQMKDALISGVNFATQNLQEPRDSTTELQKRLPCPRRSDIDFEEEVINARLASALRDPSINILINSLERINQDILRSSVDSTRTPQKPTVQEPTVFYRFSNESSQTFYDVHLGLFSQRGLLDHDFSEPLEYEFRAHVDGDRSLKSPYISLTTDPGRAMKIGRHKVTHAPRGLHHEVYQIDAAKLRRVKIDTESTTDPATRWRIVYTGQGNRLHYVTDSHWLAWFWIPTECIIGKLPFSEFGKLCEKHGIINSMYQLELNGNEILTAAANTDVVALGMELPVDAFKEKCESLIGPEIPEPKSVDDHDEPEEQSSPASPINAEVGPLKLPTPRKVPRRKPVDVNDDKRTETPTAVQNPPSAESSLEQGFQALDLSDG